MHILIIPSWYPTHPDDIGGSFFREQALALARNGCRVGVIVCPLQRSLRQWPTIFTGPYGLRIEDDNGMPTLRWHGMRWFQRFPALNRRLLIRQGMRLFAEYVARYGMPDILHAHAVLNGGVIAHAVSRHTGIPYVITEHSTAYARKLIPPSERAAALEAVTRASRLLAVSEPFAELLANYFGAEAGTWEFVPNIVNKLFVDRPIDRCEKSSSDFTFLSIALLTPKKAMDSLIEAFGRSFRNTPRVTLRIGGDGPERQRLEELAQASGTGNRIHFLGSLTRDQVAAEMARADAFVLPSRYETFGVVVVEALAMGKPVVATRCGGPESIIRLRDGHLVPVDDPPALGAAMQRLHADIATYNPAEIRQACLERFGETAITSRLKEMYEEALAGRQAGTK